MKEGAFISLMCQKCVFSKTGSLFCTGYHGSIIMRVTFDGMMRKMSCVFLKWSHTSHSIKTHWIISLIKINFSICASDAEKTHENLQRFGWWMDVSGEETCRAVLRDEAPPRSWLVSPRFRWRAGGWIDLSGVLFPSSSRTIWWKSAGDNQSVRRDARDSTSFTVDVGGRGGMRRENSLFLTYYVLTFRRLSTDNNNLSGMISSAPSITTLHKHLLFEMNECVELNSN